MSISKRLKILRGKKTLAEFGAENQIHPQTIHKYEKGRMPSAEFLVSLAQKGVNVNWLLTGEGPMYIEKKPTKEPPSLEEVAEMDPKAFMAMLSQEELEELLPAARELMAALTPQQMRQLGEKYMDTPEARLRWVRRVKVLGHRGTRFTTDQPFSCARDASNSYAAECRARRAAGMLSWIRLTSHHRPRAASLTPRFSASARLFGVNRHRKILNCRSACWNSGEIPFHPVYSLLSKWHPAENATCCKKLHLRLAGRRP